MEQDEPVQTVRPVHKNNLFPTIHAPIAHVVINIEPNGKKIILWNDILQAFKDACHARHGTKILPFLKGPDYKYLDPLRFNAVPDEILDIVVDGEFTSTDPTPVQSTFQDISDHSYQYPKYNPIDRLSTPLDINYHSSSISHSYFTPERTMPTSSFWNQVRVPPPLQQRQRQHQQQQHTRVLPQTRPISLPARPLPTSKFSSSSSRPVSAQAPTSAFTLAPTPPKRRTRMDVKEAFRRIVVHIDLVALEEKGDGSPEEFLKALLCYLRAVRQGHGHAQLCVGDLFAQGDEVGQDGSRSFEWYLKAAYLGNAVAQRKIARLIVNQPSRLSAAPEAILGDLAKEAQAQSKAVDILVETHAELQPVLEERTSEVSVVRPVGRPLEAVQVPAYTYTVGTLHGMLISVDSSDESHTLWEESSQSSDVNVDLDLIDLRSIDSDDNDDNDNDPFNINCNYDKDDNDNKDSKDSKDSKGEVDHYHNTPVRTANIGRSPQATPGSNQLTSTIIPRTRYHRHRIDFVLKYDHDSEDIEQTRIKAESGDAGAQIKMGDMCLQKDDRKQHEEAVQWFFKAASQGDSGGQHKVGDMFMNGLGVSLDHKAALYWYLEAAEQGDVGAQSLVAMLYRRNWGGSRNNPMAEKWFLLHRF